MSSANAEVIVVQDTWDEPEDQELLDFLKDRKEAANSSQATDYVIMSEEKIAELKLSEIAAPFFDTSIVQDLLKKENVTYELPDCYPVTLQELYGRKIQRITAAECLGLNGYPKPELPFFVKPVGQAKTFGQRVSMQAHLDHVIEAVGDDTDQLVYRCSFVDFISEFRLFIAEHKVVGQVDASDDVLGAPATVMPPTDFVAKVVEANQDRFAVIDIGQLKDATWCVVEQNPPFALSSYNWPIAEYVQFCSHAWHWIRDGSKPHV